MKALLYKDFYMIKKHFGKYIILSVLALLLSAFIKNNPFDTTIIGISSMMPIVIMFYDDKSKWNIYETTLPYSKKHIVLSKYIISIIFILIAIMMYFLLEGINHMVYKDFNLIDSLKALSRASLCSLATPIITLPFIYKLGIIKGGWYGLWLAAIDTRSNVGGVVMFREYGLEGIIRVIICLVISYILSIKIYEKKEV